MKRGTKRGVGDTNYTDFERFEKRLRLLTLRNTEQNGDHHIYTPISRSQPSTHTPPDELPYTDAESSLSPGGSMRVDDEPHRIYIHDLDAELADTAPEEERLVFLPDIEKHFSKIPHQVLDSANDNDDSSRALVLYDVPKSLTMDEGHSQVRQAIEAARQRAREKAAEEARYNDMRLRYDWEEQTPTTEVAHGYNRGYHEDVGGDPDAMDLG